MECFKFFDTYIQLMAGVNFAFIIGDFIGKALGILFDSKELLDNKNKSTREQIAADIESIKAMAVLQMPDGSTNEEDLNVLKTKYEELSAQWTTRYDALKNQLDNIKGTKGFSLLFLFGSVYSVLALVLVAIYQSVSQDWNCEFFACVFNVACVGVLIKYVVETARFKDVRMSKESVRCVWLYIIAIIVSAAIVLINWLLVSNGIVILYPISWLCKLVNSAFVFIPAFPLLFASGFIIYNDILSKKAINKLSKDFDEQFIELHKEKIDKDRMYNTFKKPTVKFG